MTDDVTNQPPPLTGGNAWRGDPLLIQLAERFSDPVRRELHRKYIRQCLNNFRDNNGVIQLTGEECTGPLHFVKFWLDVIRDWEKETGKKQTA